MDQTSSSTTLSHDSTLHPPSDDSGGKSTPIRTPSRSSSSFDDDRSSPLQLDDLSKLRKPPQAHREEPRRVTGSRGVGERDDSDNDDDDDDSDNAEDDALVLEQDPAEMSSWSGQPSIRGSSEAMRMILLTFNTLGITYVALGRCRLGSLD